MTERASHRRKYHFIYKTTCLITGKYYMGMHSTDDLDDGYLGSGKRLQRSVKKHGWSNHVREIYEMCSDRESLRFREAELIDGDRLKDPMCMNLIEGGAGPHEYKLGRKRSDETRARMSKAQMGKKHSAEARENMSKAKRQKSYSEQGRGVSPLRGRKLTPEHIEKMSLAFRGRKYGARPASWREALSKSHMGLKQSPETIEKRVSKFRGKPRSEETKAKLREAALRQWERKRAALKKGPW